MEQFFRSLRRAQRRKTGNNSLRQMLYTMLAETPLIKNLDNPEYMEVLLDGKSSLEELFASLDRDSEFTDKRAAKKSERIIPGFRYVMKIKNLPELACALSSPAGEEQYPHPLWDELTGKIEDKEQAASLQNREIISRDKPARYKKDPATLPRPEPLWRLEQPELCARRSQESPNSLSSLLSCPLQWVLSYQGRLSRGLTASLSEPEELEGWFVHEIVARVLLRFRDNPGNVGKAVKAVDEIFDEQGPYLAARFFLPGFDHLRAKVRNTTREAVSQILQIVQQGGFGMQYVEEPLKRQLTDPDFTLEGKPDLVLSSPLAVLDMKRGGLSFRRGEIETGSSVQLAVYSRLLVQNHEQPLPPAGYFMLWSGQLITAYPRVFPGAMHIEGPPLEETWNAITQGYISNWEELEQGEIRAPGNEQEPLSESGIVDGRLHLKPFAFCGLDTLCGKAFAQE